MFFLILLSTLFAYLFYTLAVKPISYWKDKGVVQGRPVWLFGDAWKTFVMRESIAQWLVDTYNGFPNHRYAGIYNLTMPILLIRDPKLLKQVTVKDFDHFTDHRNFIPDDVDPLWNKNVFSLRGQKWKEMRPLLSPAFTSSKMKTIFVIMSECVDNFVKYFRSKGDITDEEMKDIFTRFGTDVIASAAFGIKVDSLANPENEFYLLGKEATSFKGFFKILKVMAFTIFPPITKVIKVTLFSDKVTKYFYQLIDEAIKTREEKNIVRPDIIQLLIDARKGKDKHEDQNVVETGFATLEEVSIKDRTNLKHADITNMDIAAQAMGFFFAGFDSITTQMCFMAYELALNPDIQERLREEIKETNAACNGKLTYDALMKMKYMDMVVSESLRKWPSITAVDRRCTKPITIPAELPHEKPLDLNTNDTLWIPIFAFHRNPKFYPDPEKFDPERFSDENKGSIDPYTYLPFGLGPRGCMGSRFALMETKTLFYHLLLNFEILTNEKTPIPPIIQQTVFNVSIKGGFHLKLKRI